MTLTISRARIDALDFDFATAVGAYAAALDAHAQTVGEPAPRAHPLVEAARHTGGYVIVEPPVPEPPTIDVIKDAAAGQVDGEIQQARLRFVTGVFGQDTVYKDKLAEARAALTAITSGAAPGPDDVDGDGRYLYRYLRREIGTTGATLEAVAQVVADLGRLWDDRLSPALEGFRITGKHHVGLAADATGVEAVTSLVADAVSAIVALSPSPTLADQVDALIAAIVWPAGEGIGA